MRAVGLKVLKNRLSEYVRIVAGGETVLVTDHDRVVAEIIPPRPGRAEHSSDTELAELVRQGVLTPPLRVGAGVPPRRPIMSFRELMRGLSADRDDR